MKAKYFKLFTMLSSVLLFVSLVQVKPACFGMMYQPKAPKYFKGK